MEQEPPSGGFGSAGNLYPLHIFRSARLSPRLRASRVGTRRYSMDAALNGQSGLGLAAILKPCVRGIYVVGSTHREILTSFGRYA